MRPFRTKVFSGLAVLLLAAGFLQAPLGRAADASDKAAQKAVERRQRVEFLSFFLKDPKQAEIPKANLAVEAFNRAVEYTKNNDYGMARQALDESLTYDDKSWFSYELLGDIDYLQQQMVSARDNYERAYALRPSESLKAKLQKLREEIRVEKKLATDRGKNFIIKYHGEDQRYERFELRELLRNTYQSLSKDFGYYFKHQVVVLLYDQDEFRKISQMPHWVGGAYDGKIRMPVYKKGFNENDLAALTTHEMTHAFVGALSAARAPVWINEGLAEFEENKIKKKDKTILRAAIKTKQLYSIDQLTSETTVMHLRDPLRITLFYQQSQSLVEFMMDRYRMVSIKRLLAEFGKGKDTDEALRSALRISTDRLEREWKESINAGA